MPTLSRFYVRSALISLAIGYTIGALILAVKGGFGDSRLWILLPVHIGLLVEGWLIQLALGMTYWILPRIHGSERGRPRWAWAGFVCQQAGLVCLLVAVLSYWDQVWRILLVPAFGLQAVGVIIFCIHLKPRIRAVIVSAGSAARAKAARS